MDIILEKIKSYDMQTWVENMSWPHYFMTGSQIYREIFEPIDRPPANFFFPTSCIISPHINTKNERRVEFFTDIGYTHHFIDSCDKNMHEYIKKTILKTIKNKFSNIYVFDYPSLYNRVTMNWVLPGLSWRKEARNQFRDEIKRLGYTLEKIARLYNAVTDEQIYKKNIIIRDSIILEDLPKHFLKRKQKHHKQRKEISKLAITHNIPSDLVPTICAYAVPNSKIWNYM